MSCCPACKPRWVRTSSACPCAGRWRPGDFDPATSDLDLLVATQHAVSTDEFTRVADLHERLAELNSRYARHHESAYIHRAALRR